MATLNITTAKTRAQMVTELTNWADATKVSGSDYVWACADHINVTAEIELYGFNLIFSSGRRIYASAGGNIKVSTPFADSYYNPTTISVKGNRLSALSFVSGTGKWTGSGLIIKPDIVQINFNSTTSQTNLQKFVLDAYVSNATYFRCGLHNDGEININRISGATMTLTSGKLSMNEGVDGLVSGESYSAAKILANSKEFFGFTIQSTAAKPIYTTSTGFSATTMTFIDGKLDPLHLQGYPKDNDSVIRLIKRTITFKPVLNDGSNISGFKYRISSNRVLQPAGTTTTNFTIVQDQSADFNGTYLLTVWRGSRPTGTATYNPLRDRTIDKDMRVQYRKYGLKEATFSSNSYNFAVDGLATMQVDTYVKETNAVTVSGWINSGFTKAHQFYDLVRYLVTHNFAIPDDLLTTDGETLTIKDTWKLERSTLYDSSYITSDTKTITIGQTSSINKDDTGIWKYDAIAGEVDTSMTGHTNLVFARTDGKANLVLNITCPAGSKDPVVAIWPFSQGLDNRANLITGQATGTGVRNVTLVVDATVKYYCIAKALGANLYRPFSIDPVGGLGGSKDITLFVYEKNDGTPLFPDTLTPAQTAVADTLDFHGTHIDVKIPTDFASNPRWSATDKIWQYTVDDFIAIAYKLDVIQTALTLSVARNQLIFMREGMLLISAAADDKILEQDPANKTTVSSTTNVKVSFTTISIGRIGDTDARNTFIDDVNGTIDVRGGVPINGGFSIADANRLVVVETKANETHQRLALDSTKPLTSKPDGGITSTGIAITATELADGSVVQTRGT